MPVDNGMLTMYRWVVSYSEQFQALVEERVAEGLHPLGSDEMMTMHGILEGQVRQLDFYLTGMAATIPSVIPMRREIQRIARWLGPFGGLRRAINLYNSLQRDTPDPPDLADEWDSDNEETFYM